MSNTHSKPFFERNAARDNKALVHTDVEVVQRPSKSWLRVQYEDHDWEKDSNRTIAVTTYQLLKVKDVSDSTDEISHLNSIPLCNSRLSGPGISVVKMSYFQKESIFRHLNETLFIMSLETNVSHFMKNGSFVNELVFIVDGGGDERPRNKLTKFVMVLLRRVLNLDRVKVVSYAEGDSKRHSVELLPQS